MAQLVLTTGDKTAIIRRYSQPEMPMCLVSFSKQKQYAALEKLQRFSGTPKWAYLVITDRCSHSCPWCYGNFGNRQGREMSLEEFDTVLNKLEILGVHQVTLSGGEPTEHPDFFDILPRLSSFHIHIASHGAHIGEDMARRLSEYGVRQVQINFQGSRHGDRIHGSGSYSRQVSAIKALLERNIEVVAMVTVGKYNLEVIDEVFREAADLGVTRLRVWESTGRGSEYLCGLDAASVLESCADAARSLGYVYSLSYDPDYVGDINVPCLQLSNLYLYIDSSCRLRFCGAVEDAAVIANFLTDTPEEILRAYLDTNARILNDRKPWCPAREEAAVNRVKSDASI
jgi:MoaA/NifB/PqqE/SkfB family radical SAM enzyme